jgi:6-phosphogluconolactonase
MLRALYAGILILLASSSVFANTFVYVSIGSEDAIAVFRMDEATGALTKVDTLKVDGAAGALTFDPQRKFLFASLRSTRILGSYRIDAATGKFTPVGSTKVLGSRAATYLSTDRTGRFLFAPSYAGARVDVFAIGADGGLSAQPVDEILTSPSAHSVAVDADNRNVFVPHVQANVVFHFRFEPEKNGRIIELARSPGSPGSGPRHIALHPSQRWAFTSNETNSTMTLWSIPPNGTGVITAVQTLPTIPADFKERNTPADSRVHPSGKFVWISNRGHDSLAGFRFDAEAGQLTSLGHTPAEKTPSSLDIDPSGRFLFAGGEGSGKLAAFSINADTGQLTRIATYDLGGGSTWVAAVKLP